MGTSTRRFSGWRVPAQAALVAILALTVSACSNPTGSDPTCCGLYMAGDDVVEVGDAVPVRAFFSTDCANPLGPCTSVGPLNGVSWSSHSPAIASVEAAAYGVNVRGRLPGQAIIGGGLQGKWGSHQILVIPHIDRFAFAPPGGTLSVGDTLLVVLSLVYTPGPPATYDALSYYPGGSLSAADVRRTGDTVRIIGRAPGFVELHANIAQRYITASFEVRAP